MLCWNRPSPSGTVGRPAKCYSRHPEAVGLRVCAPRTSGWSRTLANSSHKQVKCWHHNYRFLFQKYAGKKAIETTFTMVTPAALAATRATTSLELRRPTRLRGAISLDSIPASSLQTRGTRLRFTSALGRTQSRCRLGGGADVAAADGHR